MIIYVCYILVYSHINISIYTYINIFVLYLRKIGIFCPTPSLPTSYFSFLWPSSFPPCHWKESDKLWNNWEEFFLYVWLLMQIMVGQKIRNHNFKYFLYSFSGTVVYVLTSSISGNTFLTGIYFLIKDFKTATFILFCKKCLLGLS